MGRRKMLKAAAVLLTLGYCSLLVYKSEVALKFLEAPKELQVPDLYIGPVTKTRIVDSGQSENITLDDVFISVKTTKHYQTSRLPLILKTWYQLAKDQIWFFTDVINEHLQNQTNGHMVNTNCSTSHQSEDLCCKTSVEYDHFLHSGKKWFCHFDDDNYVNVPRLVSILQKYNYQEDWYLGRSAYDEPVKKYKRTTGQFMFSFWFATGGAGFCLTRNLALKMVPLMSGSRFISICEGINFPDDVAIGFIVEHVLSKSLTVVQEFHSHFEKIKLLPLKRLKDQISFSYSKGKDEWNVVNVPGFDTQYDPTRFLSLHCFLFPHFKFCPR